MRSIADSFDIAKIAGELGYAPRVPFTTDWRPPWPGTATTAPGGSRSRFARRWASADVAPADARRWLVAPMSVRWLVTGAAGMLGHDVQSVLARRRPDDPVTPTDVADLDITDPDAVAAPLGDGDVVVNCATWTDVDEAETNEATAFRINAVRPQMLARACAAADTRLLHISTGYVFDGAAISPYAESALVNPASAYGRTKAAGKWAVRAHAPHHAWILRTAWLYGWHGASFIATILRHAGERDTSTSSPISAASPPGPSTSPTASSTPSRPTPVQTLTTPPRAGTPPGTALRAKCSSMRGSTPTECAPRRARRSRVQRHGPPTPFWATMRGDRRHWPRCAPGRQR